MDALARLWALADRYPDRYLIGEVADVESIAVSAKYTGGLRALHSCYNFQFTQEDFGTARLNAVIGRTESLMRSEEHTSELQSLMRISYAVFCLKKKKK